MSVDEAAVVEIPVTKGVETETDVVTEGGVDRGVVTEEVTVTNGELSNDGITDDEGSLSGDKLEDESLHLGDGASGRSKTQEAHRGDNSGEDHEAGQEIYEIQGRSRRRDAKNQSLLSISDKNWGEGWQNKLDKAGQGKRSRNNSVIRMGGNTYRTRADSINGKSLRAYGKQGNSTQNMKSDWLCVCEKQNYEKNTHCRWCSLPKEDGFMRVVEVAIGDKSSNRSKNIRTTDNLNKGAEKAKLPEGVEAERSKTRHVTTKIIGATLRNRNKDEQENKKNKLELKFIKNDGKIVTMEELDEALNVEQKGAKEIKGVSRGMTGVSVELQEDYCDLKWRSWTDMPIKVSSSSIYLGSSE